MTAVKLYDAYDGFITLFSHMWAMFENIYKMLRERIVFRKPSDIAGKLFYN